IVRSACRSEPWTTAAGRVRRRLGVVSRSFFLFTKRALAGLPPTLFSHGVASIEVGSEHDEPRPLRLEEAREGEGGGGEVAVASHLAKARYGFEGTML